MKSLVTVLFVCGVLTVSSFAGPTVTFSGMGDNYGTYSGFGGVYAGEMKFSASGITGVADGQFISFCVEGNERVNSGTTYDAILSNAATHGGVGGGDPDPLSNSTAWLYNNYLDNVIGSSSDTLAKDYQMAIWYLEEEVSDWSDLSANAQSLVGEAQTHSTWNNTTIKVLNLYVKDTYGTSNPIYMQDCLVRVVPIPGAVLIASFGTVVLGWIRRRKIL